MVYISDDELSYNMMSPAFASMKSAYFKHIPEFKNHHSEQLFLSALEEKHWIVVTVWRKYIRGVKEKWYNWSIISLGYNTGKRAYEQHQKMSQCSQKVDKNKWGSQKCLGLASAISTYRKQPQVCAGNRPEDGLQSPHFLLCVSCADNYSFPRCDFDSIELRAFPW